MNDITSQLRQPVERATAKELPKFIEYFSRNQDATLSVQYIHLLFNWMHSLEKQHYKTYQFKSEDNYERRLERVLLFIEFSRQESTKDGALLMCIWRYQFAAVEVLLLCRQWRVAIAEDRSRVLGKLRHPDVQFLKTVLTIQQQLLRKGQPLTINHATDEWLQYRQSKGQSIGKIAIENFRNKYTQFEQVINDRRLYERGWACINNAENAE